MVGGAGLKALQQCRKPLADGWIDVVLVSFRHAYKVLEVIDALQERTVHATCDCAAVDRGHR